MQVALAPSATLKLVQSFLSPLLSFQMNPSHFTQSSSLHQVLFADILSKHFFLLFDDDDHDDNEDDDDDNGTCLEVCCRPMMMMTIIDDNDDHDEDDDDDNGTCLEVCPPSNRRVPPQSPSLRLCGHRGQFDHRDYQCGQSDHCGQFDDRDYQCGQCDYQCGKVTIMMTPVI